MAELWTFNPRKRHKIAQREPFDLRKHSVWWSIMDSGRSQAARVLRGWPGLLKAGIRRHRRPGRTRAVGAEDPAERELSVAAGPISAGVRQGSQFGLTS